MVILYKLLDTVKLVYQLFKFRVAVMFFAHPSIIANSQYKY